MLYVLSGTVATFSATLILLLTPKIRDNSTSLAYGINFKTSPSAYMVRLYVNASSQTIK